jgi:hypothetical protein
LPPISKFSVYSAAFSNSGKVAALLPGIHFLQIKIDSLIRRMHHTRKLLLVIESGGYGNLRPMLEAMGFEVEVETSARRGMSRLKSWLPDVLVADFYRRYYHDRVSNLESLLAVATRRPATRIIVLYDPFHAADLELLKQRHRIDIALPLPLNTAALQSVLSAST